MSSVSLPTVETTDKLVAEVRSHPNGQRLAAFCLDVLSGQAEGRALYAGRRLMRVRAGNHRLSRPDAECSLGNVLAILERGPERSAEWAMISAFAVRGLDDKLTESSAAERREVVERFARHADWLELSTPYAPYRFAPELLSESNRDVLGEALETFVLAPADGPSTAAHRARATLRLHVLSTLGRPSTQSVFEHVIENTQDPWILALARHALGGQPPVPAENPELLGAWGRLPRLSVWRVVQYFTGIALLAAVWRFVAYGFGLESSARVRLETNAVHVHRETRLFGRTLRASDASYALKDVECATREVSMPTFQVLFGALALVLGVVLGTIWISDGLARADHELMLTGVFALLAGAGLDLFFAGWGSLRHERAGFEMFVDNERVVALRRVDPQRAQRMVQQIAARRA
ncbi:MAG: hypothetical protein QM778_02815 [Myxococcales bacterium]